MIKGNGENDGDGGEPAGVGQGDLFETGGVDDEGIGVDHLHRHAEASSDPHPDEAIRHGGGCRSA